MKKIICIILLLAISQFSISQDETGQKINVLTPNAESFKIYGDIPVSLYTGIPQISIPLHTIKTDNTEIDISLNYHASGFKPENHPSWVGLGWNLNVGGVINREIKGAVDETRKDNYAVNGLGFYYSYNILNKDKWYIPGEFWGINDEFGLTNFDIDTQPDVFSFSFLGYSGKFYLNHLGEWVVQCDAPVKVLFDKADMGYDGSMFMSEHFRKFTIIDEKGIKYIFGGDNAIEYSQNMFTNNLYAKGWQAVSWYLKEIVPPVGEPVYFNYERGPYQSSFSCIGLNRPKKRGYQNTIYDYVLGDYIHGGVSGAIMSPVYLSSISCPSRDLTVSFETSKSNDLIYPETNYRDFFYKDNNSIPPPTFLAFDAVANIPYFDRNIADKNKASLSTGTGQFKDRFIWLKLDKIVLKYNNGTETVSKNIGFAYEEKADARRKLSAVTISFPQSNDPEIYSFEYNQSLPADMTKEPEYLSEYGDHWGYANNKFMWKEEDVINPHLFATKERAKLGVLSKIIYPTKGYTLFVYENHDYSAYRPSGANSLVETSSTIAGGLRIKKMITVSSDKAFTSREYFYDRINREGVSSGILHLKPAYYSSNAFLFDNAGAHVTYSSVIEKYEDKSFKATHFVSEAGVQRLGEGVNPVFDDLPVYLQGDWLDAPYSRRDMERGKVSDEYYCDATGKVYKSTHYSYVNIGKNEANYVRTLDPVYMNQYAYDPNANWGSGTIKKDASAYYHYCYSNKLSLVREIQYNKASTFSYGNINMPSSGDIIMTTRNIEYDTNKQPVKESTVNSNGVINHTITKYPYSVPVTSISSKMIEANMLAFPIEQRKYVNSVLRGGYDFTYSLLNGKHILLTSLKQVYKDNSSIVHEEYKYNTIGKLVEVKDRSGLCQSYLWDYKGRNLRAILDNMSLDDLKKGVSADIINCSASATNWTSLADNLRNTFPNSFVKLYDYDYKGNLTKITSESSLSENYMYDKNERLERVSDHDQKTVQQNIYHYKKDNLPNAVYLNRFVTVSAQKQCPAGYIPQGDPFRIDISAGTYLSTVSQDDADKMAWNKHISEVQEMADAQGNCIRTQEIALEGRPGYTNLMTYRAHVEGNELIISYIYMNWESGFSYSHPSAFRSERAIAQIKDKQFIPKRTTFREYEMYGNIWTIWTEPSGYIVIRLSGEKNISAIPGWQEFFQVGGGIRFPLD